jgi:hypothetical protein
MSKPAVVSFLSVLFTPTMAFALELEQKGGASKYDPFTVKLLVVSVLAAVGMFVFTRKSGSRIE